MEANLVPDRSEGQPLGIDDGHRRGAAGDNISAMPGGGIALERVRWPGGRAAILLLVLCALAVPQIGCGGEKHREAPPPPKRFPSPIFDGLALGMSRREVAKVHRIRPTRTAAGKDQKIWIYRSPEGHSTEITFSDEEGVPRLSRIDVHFGPSDATPDETITPFERRFGAPDVRRRKASTNAYGDERHEQYDTIWSDATQYVYLTERVPIDAGEGRQVYYLTVKNKEITAAGPPTGYVPPPPQEDGEAVEEPVF
jgi:hypothetical protein